MEDLKSNAVVLYIAMSLDGYIALPDGSVDWLYDVKGMAGTMDMPTFTTP